MADPEGLGPELTLPGPAEPLPAQSEPCWAEQGGSAQLSSLSSPVQVIRQVLMPQRTILGTASLCALQLVDFTAVLGWAAWAPLGFAVSQEDKQLGN